MIHSWEEVQSQLCTTQAVPSLDKWEGFIWCKNMCQIKYADQPAAGNKKAHGKTFLLVDTEFYG